MEKKTRGKRENIVKKTKTKMNYKKMSKKELNGYKRRNLIIEMCILLVVFLIVIFFITNKTFLSNHYTNKVSGSNIDIDIPLYCYLVSDNNKDEVKLVTLRKTVTLDNWFQDIFVNEKYDIYYCGDDNTPYYYNNVGKFFITNIDIEKKLGIKIVTINYSTEDINSFCDSIK